MKRSFFEKCELELFIFSNSFLTICAGQEITVHASHAMTPDA
jgi:hypothetical protein